MTKAEYRMKQARTQEEGSYLVMGAFVLVALMITAGLAVDISRKYALEQRLQDVADAAAKAGALQLPDLSAARYACTTYIEQAVGTGGWYTHADSDVKVYISADNKSGTCGVIVHGAWDPIIMPAWLVGDNENHVARYAIALMAATSGDTGSYPTIPPTGLGELTLIVGDTDVSCGTDLEADLPGNNITIVGGTQINHTFDLTGATGEVDFEEIDVSGSMINIAAAEGGQSSHGTVTTDVDPITIPDIPNPTVDCTLDISDPTVLARYPVANTDYPLLEDDGTPVLADNGSPVTIRRDATGETWSITGPANRRITSTGNSFGNGFDLKVVGNLELATGTIDGIDGCIWTTGDLYLTAGNNSDYNATSDNPGVVMWVQGDMRVDCNNSGESIYGLVKVDGNFSMTGNGSNNTTLIRGALWAGTIDADCGGGITGQNFGITGDADVLDDVQIIDPTYNPLRSTPTVWLAV